jgi:hypothetical protein
MEVLCLIRNWILPDGYLTSELVNWWVEPLKISDSLLEKKSELLVILKESEHYKVRDLRRIGYDLVCSVFMRDNECHELHYHCCYIHVHVCWCIDGNPCEVGHGSGGVEVACAMETKY